MYRRLFWEGMIGGAGWVRIGGEPSLQRVKEKQKKELRFRPIGAEVRLSVETSPNTPKEANQTPFRVQQEVSHCGTRR